MNKILMTIFFLFLCIYAIKAGENQVDYHHRMLLKELKKEYGFENPVFEKLSLEPFAGKKDHYSLFHVYNIGSPENYKTVYISRVYSCRSGGCSLSGNDALANTGSEYFDYFILYNDDLEIIQVRVFNYQATHGHEICSKAWLKQFNGYKGEQQLNVGREIDAISGATISTHSIAIDIEVATNFIRQKVQKMNNSALVEDVGALNQH